MYPAGNTGVKSIRLCIFVFQTCSGLQFKQLLLDTGGMREFGDVIPGEESLEIAESLDVLDYQGGMFRGAGEDLFQSLVTGTDYIKQEVTAL